MKRTITFLNILLALLLLFTAGLPQKSANASGTSTLPILFGSYTSSNLQTTVSELTSMNNWLTSNGASGVTFAGDFISITAYGNPSWNVPHELDAAWNAGFMPFMNLNGSQNPETDHNGVNQYVPGCGTDHAIAAGQCDTQIKSWAQAFLGWINEGGGRRAFIAPLPEANGYWASWAANSNGIDFINAYKRIRSIFQTVFNNDTLFRNSVRWVFAPNGWNDPKTPWYAFENYYPGDDVADVVGFSSYNYGNCPAPSLSPTWGTFSTIMKPYLDRMQAMAPSKPIFITQTGTVADANNPGDSTETKSYWAQDTFNQLANYPGVRAILYYNLNDWPNHYEGNLPNCAKPYYADYTIYTASNNSGEAGFLTIMQDRTRFGKWATNNTNWGSVAFTDPYYVFADVQPTNPFSGAPNVYYYNYVLTLYNNGITGGCTTTPLNYCPNTSVTRDQMAVFLEKGLHGSTFSPSTISLTFTDTKGNFAQYWIEALKNDGITGGCGGGNYCPSSAVTRAQMAIFLLKSEHGSSYNPPPATGTKFTDVPSSYWAASWIEQLANEGITGGCGGGNYCPDQSVTRAQMAIFLVKTFGLH